MPAQTPPAVHPYRVFISYARKEELYRDRLAGRLKGLGLRPLWDMELAGPGDPFSASLREGIAHAHIFMPILTAESMSHPWVHQETGYAMGVNVPVVPVTVGEDPSGLAAELQALKTAPDFSDLATERLTRAIERLLEARRAELALTFACAARPEARAAMLAFHTGEASGGPAFGPLRQRGALTSFSLPNVSPNSSSIWEQRDGNARRGAYVWEPLYEERRQLEAYAREHGCRLMIDPGVEMKEYGPAARRVRLQTLLEFLTDETVDDLQVAVRPRVTPGNLTVVGDWFSAESTTPRPGVGYHQTQFTWHAPTVLQQARQFDTEFAQMLRAQKLSPEDSQRHAVGVVTKVLEGLPADAPG